VQNVPLVLPDEPLWQSGKAVLGQSLLLDVSAHCVVHAANNCARFEQLKHVVPDAQGLPQSRTKVVQVPSKQVMPACTVWRLSTELSSIMGDLAAHPHAG
jgi:quinolinate synthase